MARQKYATVKIPVELAGKLDSCCRHWGYRSRAEMVDDAVRLFVARMKEIESGKTEASPATVPAE